MLLPSKIKTINHGGSFLFRLDCGTGVGVVRSTSQVHLNQWNHLSVFRHDWAVWIQLNGGRKEEGRSQVSAVLAQIGREISFCKLYLIEGLISLQSKSSLDNFKSLLLRNLNPKDLSWNSNVAFILSLLSWTFREKLLLHYRDCSQESPSTRHCSWEGWGISRTWPTSWVSTPASLAVSDGWRSTTRSTIWLLAAREATLCPVKISVSIGKICTNHNCLIFTKSFNRTVGIFRRYLENFPMF